MIVKINFTNVRVFDFERQIKMLLGVRSVMQLTKMKYSQHSHQKSPEHLFKFYNENDGSSFSDKYKPLKRSDYEKLMSARALTREPALTRLITSLGFKVGKKMISLAEGMPNEQIFPFDNIHIQFKSGQTTHITGEELATALQYIPSQGLPSLLRTLQEFQAFVHRPPPHDRDIIVTNGAQHAIYQCCELLVDPGDPVILSEFAYTGVQISLKPYKPEILSIPEDTKGIRPEVLEAILESRRSKGMKMPKILYTIPIGNNPTGTVIPEDRKRHIYELACKYNFLILEDDPYMYLNYSRPVPSFISMDSCGRVIRMDSLSKVVSSGLRAGWVTGPTCLIERMELHMQAEMLHTCSLGQVIMGHVLSDRTKLAAHLTKTREFYRVRRDALHEALQAANMEEVGDWSISDAGLFIWMKVKGVEDVYNMVFKTAMERGLMLIPGHAFSYDSTAPSRHLRLTFSKCPPEKMGNAASKLAEIIRNEQKTSARREISFANER